METLCTAEMTPTHTHTQNCFFPSPIQKANLLLCSYIRMTFDLWRPPPRDCKFGMYRRFFRRKKSECLNVPQ